MSPGRDRWDAASRTSSGGGVRVGPGEPCGPCGALERLALEDGGVRLDRVRGARRRRGQHRRRAPDEALGDRERRVPPGRADPRPGELQDPRSRERAGAVAVGHHGRPGRAVLGGGRIGRADALPAARRRDDRVPDRASERRPDLGGSPLRARAVRRRRAGRQGEGQDRADPRVDDRCAGSVSEHHRRGVRAGLRRLPGRAAIRARHGAGRADLAAPDDRDPDRRVRLARGSRSSCRPGVLGGARRDRPEHRRSVT